MAHRSKPYIKCEKRDGMYFLSVMKGIPGGHVLKGRGTVPTGDMLALRTKVIQMMATAREGEPNWEKQADGNS